MSYFERELRDLILWHICESKADIVSALHQAASDLVNEPESLCPVPWIPDEDCCGMVPCARTRASPCPSPWLYEMDCCGHIPCERRNEAPASDRDTTLLLSACLSEKTEMASEYVRSVERLSDTARVMLEALRDGAELLSHLGTSGKTTSQDEAIYAVRESFLEAIKLAETQL